MYGDIKEGRHTETDLLKPSNPYSAAKAAAEGKQGILKSKRMDALKKKLQEARKKRLSKTTTKKSGGKIKKVPIITVGKGTYKGKVVGTGKKTVSRSEGGSVVARQVRGWGKARKPKK